MSELTAFLEALLFLAERPLSEPEAAELAAVRPGEARAALDELAAELAGSQRGLRLQRDGTAWQMITAPELGERLTAYAARTESRLTPAALEALAVIAYHQPCTRGEVERIRGVDSDYVIRSLMHRRLVVEIGRRDTPGRPILFGTSFAFLERFGLTSLDDLTPLPAIQEAVAVPVEVDEGVASEPAAEPADAG